MNEIGERIKEIRIAQNLTQEEVAEDIGISLSTIKRFETGKESNLENFLCILRYYNCLQNLDLLIPEQQQSVEDIYKGISKRQRASKEKEVNEDFKWGDEL